MQLQTTSSFRYNKITFALRRERVVQQERASRVWSRARQRDLLTDRISFERLKSYFERLAVNG